MQFRKKPVVIEAEQYFINKQSKIKGICVKADVPGICNAHIHTLKGPLQISDGDWIITGVKGERYPCKPDIFEATYEKVTP